MKKFIRYLSAAALTISTVTVNTTAVAQGGVQFNLEPRGPGAGYNHTHFDRRVAQPKSIYKGSAANQAVHDERRFVRRLGPKVRGDMSHRGDVARHARHKGQIKSTLKRQARKPKTRFSTSRLSPEVQRNMDRRGNQARQSRGKGNPSSARASKLQTNKVSRSKGVSKNKNTLKAVKKGKKLRTLGKIAAGGVVIAGGTLVAETALGVDIPDAVDAAEWTYGTLKDPKQAPKRFKKLGRDSGRTLKKAGRTLTNPKKMGKNLKKGAKKAGKSIKKASCSVGKIFGAKC